MCLFESRKEIVKYFSWDDFRCKKLTVHFYLLEPQGFDYFDFSGALKS
jgi:hypothetical protein